MQRNPILIAKEYLQLTEPPQVRKNALTALAILGESDAWALIVDAAVSDPDVSVREHAEEELSALAPEVATKAVATALSVLTDASKNRAAYALLGRLRRRGVTFELPWLPLTTRLRLAKSIKSRVDGRRGVSFFLRTWQGAVIGVGLAWLVLLIFTGAALDVHVKLESELMYLGLVLVATTAVIPPATHSTAPIHAHADVGAAALLDAVMAAVTAAGFALLSVILWSGGSSAGPAWPLLLIAPLAAVAVRVGTLSAYGLAKTRSVNFLLQTFVGGAAGGAIVALAVLASSGADHPVNQAAGVMVLISCGLAGAYGWIDKRSEPRVLVPRRVVAVGLLAVVFMLGVAVKLTFFVERTHEASDVDAFIAFPQIASELSWARPRSLDKPDAP